MDDGALPYFRQDAEDFVALVEQWWEDGSQTVWGVYADDVLVGMVGLHHIEEHPAGGHAELGYWVVADARGRGYLVEAARAVLDWGFAELGLARIRWQAVVGNVPPPAPPAPSASASRAPCVRASPASAVGTTAGSRAAARRRPDAGGVAGALSARHA